VAAGDTHRALAGRQDAAGRPFRFEDRLTNHSAVPDAADETFAVLSPGPWLVARVPWTTAEHRISAAAAEGAPAEALRLREGAPCLVVERRTWIGDQPVTQVTLTYPGGGHELVARFTPSQN
jgi:GntR family histidine utilization transcriptional repressor